MSKETKYDYTATERKRSERERMKDLGFKRRDVWAHPDDWEQIRKLEKKLQEKRLSS